MVAVAWSQLPPFLCNQIGALKCKDRCAKGAKIRPPCSAAPFGFPPAIATTDAPSPLCGGGIWNALFALLKACGRKKSESRLLLLLLLLRRRQRSQSHVRYGGEEGSKGRARERQTSVGFFCWSLHTAGRCMRRIVKSELAGASGNCTHSE